MSRPGGQIHHRVGAPQRRPLELLDLFLDRRGDGRVADVRVDLHQEVPADDHRLELGVIDVGRDDGAAARDLAADELGVEPFAQRDVLHLGRHHALARVVQLRHALARPGLQRQPGALGDGRRHLARPGRLHELPRTFGDVAAPDDPVAAAKRQPLADIDAARTAGVVDAQGRLAARQRDLPHRHGDGHIAGAAFDIHFAGIGKRVAVVACRHRGVPVN